MFIHDTPIGEDYGSCDVVIKDCSFYCYNSLHFLHLESIAEEDTVNMHFLDNKFHVVSSSDPAQYSSSYIGCTVAGMVEMDISDTLVDNGFSGNDLVFCYDEELTAAHKANIRGVENPLETVIDLPEGITVLWNGRAVNDKQCYFPIDIRNNSFDGGKWLNSACFELAPDSTGNTFAQMNYSNSQ